MKKWTRRTRRAPGQRRGEGRVLRPELLETRNLLSADMLLAPVDMLDLQPQPESGISTANAASAAESEHVGDQDLVAFAKALAASGTKMYGAAWCPACTAQKQLFEDGGDFLPFIEVTNPDRTLNQIGIDNNITAFPTWVFPDGSRETGVQTLQTLSERSGVAIPTGVDPSIAPIGDKTVFGGSPLHVALDGYDPNGGPLTYTVTSSNPSLVQPTLITGNRSAQISTLSYGDMVFQLFEQRAPRPTSRFIELANSGFYNGIAFHRVIDNFVAQAGDPTGTGSGGSDLGDFDDQFHVELQHNQPGVLSYAKAGDDTNDSQFFITDVPTRFLDANHSIFGQLIEGEKNRDALTATATDASDRPLFSVLIDSISIFQDTENGLVMLSAPEGASGEADITVTVTDQDGNSSQQVFRVTVAPDPFNTGPFLADIGEIQTTVDTPAEFQLQAIDVEGDPVRYSGVKQGSVDYTFNVDPDTGQVTVTPPSGYVGPMELLVRVAPATTSNTADPFDSQLVTINVLPQANGVVDLTDASDSGISSTDNITNLDNLEFLVTGVDDGATITLKTGTTVLGTATANGDQATISTAALSNLGDGTYEVYATQTVNGVESAAFGHLNVTIDKTPPAPFDSSPPTSAQVGSQLQYDAQHPDEGLAGFSYALQGAPSGMVFDPETGLLTWTPTSADVGLRQFTLLARDAAGNERSQDIAINVLQQQANQRVVLRLGITDADGIPITDLTAGEDFFLRGFVEDKDDQGVFAAYFDINYPSTLAEVTGPVSFSGDYPHVTSGNTDTPGLIDEVGATSGSLSPIGGGEFLMFTVPMRATGTGTLTFTSDAPDELPFHEILVFGTVEPVDLQADVFYGSTSITVDGAFVTGPDLFNVDEDSQNNQFDVLVNDTFLPGFSGSLSIVDVTAPSQGGTATIVNGGGTIEYTPLGDFFGEETFQYTASDGTSQVTGTVTVQVQPVNDDPTANADSFVVNEDSNDNLLDVLQNDSIAPDADETLQITSVSAGDQGGTIVIGPTDDHLLYTPAADFVGTETFTYTISDGNGGSDSNTVTVTVSPFNDPPVARDDAFTVDEDTTDHLFDVLANDDSGADEGETISLTQVFTPNNGGTATIDNGQIRYSPAPDFFGEERFEYQITDSNGATARATVVVTVNNVNDPPIANPDQLTVVRDVSDQVLDLLGNDSPGADPAEPLSIIDATSATDGASVQIAEDGKTVLYTPPAGFTGTDTITYRIADPAGEQSETTATIEVLDFTPGSISGSVYFDVNHDGQLNPWESRIGEVTITLTGTDFRGQDVQRTATTDADGSYQFADLAPGTYTLSEESLGGLLDGRETAGSEGGDTSVNDQITLELTDGAQATGYLFGERGRLPQFIVLGDFLASTDRYEMLTSSAPQVHDSVPDNGATNGEATNGDTLPSSPLQWYSLRGDWNGTQSADLAFNANDEVELSIADGNDNIQQTTLPMEDAVRVHRLGEEPDNLMLRFPGGPQVLNFSAQPIDGGGVNAEGESIVGFSTPVTAPAAVDAWMANIGEAPEGEWQTDDWFVSPGGESDSYAEEVDALLAEWAGPTS